MDKLQQDVMTESSTVEQKVDVEQSEQEKNAVNIVEEVNVEEKVDVSSAPAEVKQPGIMSTDRPDINFAMEALRKVKELSDQVESLRTQPQPKQQYSKAQLRTFAETTDDANSKLWAYGEIEKMEKEEQDIRFKEMFEKQQTRSQEETKRAQASQWVVNTFPDTLVKDTTGNVLGWNVNHPLLVRANQYMSANQNLRNDPEGFAAAVKLAAFDLGISVNPKMQNKLNQTTAQLRKEQKKNLVSGSSTPIQKQSSNLTRYQKVLEEYRKTGKTELLIELAKLKGLLSSETKE